MGFLFYVTDFNTSFKSFRINKISITFYVISNKLVTLFKFIQEENKQQNYSNLISITFQRTLVL